MDNKPTSQLKDTIFSKIEKEHVEPRSRWFFRCKEYTVWVFLFLSILVGALSVAVSLFVLSHRQYALYEATHDNFWTFMVGALPYVWLTLFGLMAGAAWYNFRHTSRGYRVCLWKVVVGSVSLSLLGGFILQTYDFGYTTDKMLGDRMELYMSQEKMERKLWQDPAAGRLVGIQKFSTITPTTTVIFEDAAGVRWNMQVNELFERDRELLATEKKVRVLGQTVNQELHIFHACGVFPWMLDKPETRETLSAERQAFVDSLYDQQHRAKDRLAKIERVVYEDEDFDEETMSMCAELSVVRRVSENMRQKQ